MSERPPKKRLNLLVIAHSFPREEKDIKGIFVLDYVKSVENYCNIIIFNPRLSGVKGLKEENFNGYKVYRFGLAQNEIKTKFKPFVYLLWLYKVWRIGTKFKDVDIIHAHGSTIAGTLGVLIGKKIKAPVIITHHSGPFSELTKNKLKKFITKNALEKANAVLTVSEHLKKQILNSSIFPKRIFVTYNPIDTQQFNTKNRIDLEKSKIIIYVGRLEEYKGGFRSLLAFQRIAKKYDDWRFAIIGDGSEWGKINKFIQKNGLCNKVQLRGMLLKSEISDVMKKSAFLIFPSEHETFGITIAEAMACGLPAIVGNRTAPKEFVDKDCGLLVNPENITQIAHAMENLIDHISNYNPELIRSKVVKKFGLESFGENLIRIYREFV